MGKIEKIIVKAISGGYENRPALQYINAKMPIKKDILTIDCILMDPFFWQALGKASKWGGSTTWVCTDTCDYYCNDCGFNLKEQSKTPKEFSGNNRTHVDCPNGEVWKDYALNFHETNLNKSFEKAVEDLSKLVN